MFGGAVAMTALASSEASVCIEAAEGAGAAALCDLPEDMVRALLLPEPLPATDTDIPRDGGALRQIDWAAIRADANAHAVGVLVFRRLRELGWTRFIDPTVIACWEADARHAELQYHLQKNDLLEIGRALVRQGIRHAFVKGAGYRELLYRPAWTRLCGDCDLLIDRDDAETVRTLLQRQGFEHAACTIDYQSFRPAHSWEIAETESQHYELAQLVKSYRLANAPPWLFGPDFERRAPFTYERTPEGVVFRSIVDVHWTLHFVLQSEDPLAHVQFARTADGANLAILSLEWSLFVTAFKLYFEAFDRPGYGLHHLTDLAAILRHAREPLDWKMIDALTRRHGLEGPIYYALSAAQALAGADVVPLELMNGWSSIPPVPPGEATRELGDFVPSMLGRRIPTPIFRSIVSEGVDVAMGKGTGNGAR
jgi:putative nucleotidyltransferase-like protein